jgi:excisionase family DNA binding protein
LHYRATFFTSIPLAEDTTVERQAISIMKACEVVGVSRRTIYNWIASGKVEYVRTAGGAVRIFADSLWRWPSEDTRSTSTISLDAGAGSDN